GPRRPLETAASRLRPLGGDAMRFRLEVVREPLELGRLGPRTMGDRLREEPVREPGVPWEQRAVQIRSDRASAAAALVPALAVVPETGDDAAERRDSRPEHGAPGMVLEPCERPRPARLELALEQHVADHPPLPCDRVVVEEADAGELDA